LEIEVSKTSKLKSEVFGIFWKHSEIEILEIEVSKTSKLKSEVFGTFWNHSEIEILDFGN
jgi:hypothetical protein